ncbi:GntR family transcriptional regulator [uncultured Cloacibacillus sp.]|uniref:GntR family transcriptional regulator n=1 Tax=uncultured Cloacibacillus sp. TaxID=889794 RepID=UPI001F92757D|nr:GntR family transcriptional regulator [uncultured Cloacibacillus sp.]HIR18072.1 GntR family transcriptional regulator [Candidatus Caccocola faecigallinarum]
MLHRMYNTSSDSVYMELRGKILSRELKPAQRLLEVKIANEMGVSRTPVREALRRLANEGLVKIVPNSGARVASPSSHEMDNSYSVREYLENMSVELACRTGMDKRTLERLDGLVRDGDAAYDAGDVDAFLAANNDFHRIIAEAGKNYVLSEYVDNIIQRTNVYIYFYSKFIEAENKSSGEHRAILRAIAQRDRIGAQELMKQHLERVHAMFSEAAAKAKEKEKE